MILTVDHILNHFVPIGLLVVLPRVRGLGLLSLPGSLTYNDPIDYISDILYIDIGKQYVPYYYIYNK